MEFGMIKPIKYNEIPPKVVYKVTPFDGKFIRILEQLKERQNEMNVESKDKTLG
jgi:DNA-binding HxlR family transcriptional regulator